MPIPTFTSPRIGTVCVVNNRIGDIIPALSPAEQRNYFSILDAFRAEVDAKGDDIQYLKGIGVVPGDADVARVKAIVIDTCNWQLAQALRYSTPTRIAEAAPYLERVIAHFQSEHPNGEVDDTPEMYLGVALHKTAGQEDAALWSRACFSRLLRRMGRVAEAEEQENAIRNWLQWHQYGMPPSEFRALVTDPEHEGKNYILEHPMVENMFAGMTEIGPGIVMHQF
ncbi:hypothetical protein B0H11DRAFT_2219103 [Mycena galericulata]|nr:hypothetical protein B0H11DRAFT_2219103 [Mycena galericulata]